MTYKEAQEYLYRFGEFNIDLSLGRIKCLLSYLGNPHESLSVIHVAGSNGKGSVCAMLSAILTFAGLKVGLYTSPHLSDIRERIRIGEASIPVDTFVQEVEFIKGVIDDSREKIFADLTFFEVLTGLAIHCFAKERVDVAVCEVGLGGRLDATNVLKPIVTAITTISLEHQEYLGDTIEKIAVEKAGIIKEGVPLVIGNVGKEAEEVIVCVAEQKKAKVLKTGEDIEGVIVNDNLDGYTVINVKAAGWEYENLRMNLLGAHQLDNALVALGVIDLFAKKNGNVCISKKSIRLGFSNVKWPGRLQVIKKFPFVVLDGAHNAASFEVLLRNIRRLFKFEKAIMLMGFLKDKDVRQILKMVEKIAAKIILVSVDAGERTFPKEEVLKFAIDKKRYCLAETLEEGVDVALSDARRNDLICITGSLYLIGEFFKRSEPMRKIYAFEPS